MGPDREELEVKNDKERKLVKEKFRMGCGGQGSAQSLWHSSIQREADDSQLG